MALRSITANYPRSAKALFLRFHRRSRVKKKMMIQIQKTRVLTKVRPMTSQHRIQPLEDEAAEVVADVVDAVEAEEAEQEDEEDVQEEV
jgi:hypothetical protein